MFVGIKIGRQSIQNTTVMGVLTIRSNVVYNKLNSKLKSKTAERLRRKAKGLRLGT